METLTEDRGTSSTGLDELDQIVQSIPEATKNWHKELLFQLFLPCDNDELRSLADKTGVGGLESMSKKKRKRHIQQAEEKEDYGLADESGGGTTLRNRKRSRGSHSSRTSRLRLDSKEFQNGQQSASVLSLIPWALHDFYRGGPRTPRTTPPSARRSCHEDEDHVAAAWSSSPLGQQRFLCKKSLTEVEQEVSVRFRDSDIGRRMRSVGDVVSRQSPPAAPAGHCKDDDGPSTDQSTVLLDNDGGGRIRNIRQAETYVANNESIAEPRTVGNRTGGVISIAGSEPPGRKDTDEVDRADTESTSNAAHNFANNDVLKTGEDAVGTTKISSVPHHPAGGGSHLDGVGNGNAGKLARSVQTNKKKTRTMNGDGSNTKSPKVHAFDKSIPLSKGEKKSSKEKLAGAPVDTFSPFSLLYNECSMAALAKWALRPDVKFEKTVAEAEEGKRTMDKKRFNQPAPAETLRRCGSCFKWGHYDIECDELGTKAMGDMAKETRVQILARDHLKEWENVSDDGDSVDSGERGNDDFHSKSTACEACGTGFGDLLICDGCDRMFHMTCQNPPLDDVPVGFWFCTKCQGYNSDVSSTIEIEGCDGFVIEQEKQSRRSFSNVQQATSAQEETAVLDDWVSLISQSTAPLLLLNPPTDQPRELDPSTAVEDEPQLADGELCWAVRRNARGGAAGKDEWWPSVIVSKGGSSRHGGPSPVEGSPYVVTLFGVSDAVRVRAFKVLPFFQHFEELGYNRIIYGDDSLTTDCLALFRKALETAVSEIGCRSFSHALEMSREIAGTQGKSSEAAPVSNFLYPREEAWEDGDIGEQDGFVIHSKALPKSSTGAEGLSLAPGCIAAWASQSKVYVGVVVAVRLRERKALVRVLSDSERGNSLELCLADVGTFRDQSLDKCAVPMGGCHWLSVQDLHMVSVGTVSNSDSNTSRETAASTASAQMSLYTAFESKPSAEPPRTIPASQPALSAKGNLQSDGVAVDQQVQPAANAATLEDLEQKPRARRRSANREMAPINNNLKDAKSKTAEDASVACRRDFELKPLPNRSSANRAMTAIKNNLKGLHSEDEPVDKGRDLELKPLPNRSSADRAMVAIKNNLKGLHSKDEPVDSGRNLGRKVLPRRSSADRAIAAIKNNLKSVHSQDAEECAVDSRGQNSERKNPARSGSARSAKEPIKKNLKGVNSKDHEDTNGQDDIFTVEQILDERVVSRGEKRIREYLVKWEGFPIEDSTWEPETNFIN